MQMETPLCFYSEIKKVGNFVSKFDKDSNHM